MAQGSEIAVARVSRAKLRKEPGQNKIKLMEIEGWPEITRMGVHGGIAEFFKLKPDEPIPSTLDYLVAVISGCMTAAIGSALEGHGLQADPEHLRANAEGILQEIDGKLLLTHVRLSYRITVPKEKRRDAERSLQVHGDRCTITESVKRGITVDWEGEIVEE